jgi:hypothetical protein
MDSIRRWFACTHGTITTKPIHEQTHRHYCYECGHTHQRDDPRKSVSSRLLQELCRYNITTRFLQSDSTAHTRTRTVSSWWTSNMVPSFLTTFKISLSKNHAPYKHFCETATPLYIIITLHAVETYNSNRSNGIIWQ